MKNWQMQQQIKADKSSNFRAGLTASVAAVLGFFKGDLFRRARRLTGLLTQKDRAELYEQRRRVFNLQRGHAHPAHLSPARRAGLEKC